MRVIFIFWMALTITATAFSENRPKRDLTFIKKIAALLLGVKNSSPLPVKDYKLYRIPGVNNVLLKVTPNKIIKETKVIVPKKIIMEPVDPKVHFLGSYLGSKTSNETLDALHQVKSLINLGVISKKEIEGIEKFLVPLIRANMKYVTKEENEIYSLKSPFMTPIKQSGSTTLLESYDSAPIIQRRPIANTILPIPVKPTYVKVSEIFEPKYSYKQIAQDGSITTYKSEGEQNIIVTETEIIPTLPPYIKFRLEDVAAKCITRVHCSRPILGDLSFSIPRPEVLEISVPSLFIPSRGTINIPETPPIIAERVEMVNAVPSTVKELRYPPVLNVLKKSGYLAGRDVDGPPVIIEEGHPILKKITTTLLPKQGSEGMVSVNIERRQNDKINDFKSSGDSHVKNLVKDRVDLDNLEELQNSDRNTVMSSKYAITSYSTISNRKTDNDANKSSKSEANNNYEVLSEQTDSQFSYKQIKHTVPAQPGGEYKAVRDLKNSKFSKQPDIIPSNHIYTPPLTENEFLPKLNKSTRNDEDVRNLQNLMDLSQEIKFNKTMEKRPVISKEEYTLSNNPIIVTNDSSYVYKQLKPNGSTTTTRGNAENVSVDIKINEENESISDLVF